MAADDVSMLILWMKLFMEAQGYPIEKNTLYQDNKSTILLETKGKRISGKRTRAFNIRFFFDGPGREGERYDRVLPHEGNDGRFFHQTASGGAFQEIQVPHYGT